MRKFIIVPALSLIACTPPKPEVGELQSAIEGREATYEFAADAPWRMEPFEDCSSGACQRSYGEIPLQLAIFDTNQEIIDGTTAQWGDLNQTCTISNTNSCHYSKRRLVQVKDIIVTQGSGTPQHFGLADLWEVETVGDHWRVQRTPKPAPPRTLCRKWKFEDCTGLGRVDSLSEWHATLMYQPPPPAAGGEVRLKVEMVVSQRDTLGGGALPDAVLTQIVSVHLGEASLPRFGDGWAYGDLHYHSQGTDNEGESGHSFRGALYGAGAIGLDFAFASDHASASEQIVAADPFPFETYFNDTLRDTDELRFATGLDWLHGPAGANLDVTSLRRFRGPTRLAVPQLFLGGEVDVVPEMAQRTKDGAPYYKIPYGNGKEFDIEGACDYPWYGAFVADEGCGVTKYTWTPQGGYGYQWVYEGAKVLAEPSGDRWLIKDLQGGATHQYYARQHMLSLPFDPARQDGFVASWTSKFGGATRRLRDFLANDYGAAQKGVVFLAHPLATPDNGIGRMAGPDIVPYSPEQLDEAFASPSVLGLQLWNEDGRLRSGGTVTGQPGIEGTVNPFKESVRPRWGSYDHDGLFSGLHHGTFTWDRYLRKGLNENELRKLSWLKPGEPRRFFMAGGSDAHGDLNYRRTGYMMEEINGYNETALGKPRNLLFAGLPQGTPRLPGVASAPFTQQQIVAGLQGGQFSVTDGPALRVAWDVNRNGMIDAADVPMGGQVDYETAPPPLLVQWLSTDEFGPVDTINLYVGVRNEEMGDLTYTTQGHGVRSSDDRGFHLPDSGPIHTSFETGRRYRALTDGYWQALDGPALQFHPGTSSGTISVNLDPEQFPIGAPNAQTFVLERSRVADRMYVRAFASTKGRRWNQGCWEPGLDECHPRLAYSNPVWARNKFPTPTGVIIGYGGKYLDALGGVPANGTPVGIWDWYGGYGQRWSWYPRTGEIVAFGIHKRLDLIGWNNNEGATVGLWDRDGAVNQRWNFANLKLRQGGFAAAVPGGNTAEGTDVILWPPTGTAEQVWRFTAAGEIRGIGDRCLDVYAWGTADGTPVKIYGCYGTANQQWDLAPGGQIRGYGGKCLTTGQSQGTRLYMATCTGAANQQWTINGEIRSEWNNKCLDVYGWYTNNGNSVLAYSCYGNPNQQWWYYP